MIESCTGGLISSALTAIPGASKILWGSLVVYSAESKQAFTGIDPGIIQSYGQVSAETIEGLVRGALERYPSRYIGAVSGIAGPEGGTDDKPVGLVYLGIACPKTAGMFIQIKKHIFKGNRQDIQVASAHALVEMLMDQMS